jgi:hypothetical protein
MIVRLGKFLAEMGHYDEGAVHGRLTNQANRGEGVYPHQHQQNAPTREALVQRLERDTQDLIGAVVEESEREAPEKPGDKAYLRRFLECAVFNALLEKT